MAGEHVNELHKLYFSGHHSVLVNSNDDFYQRGKSYGMETKLFVAAKQHAAANATLAPCRHRQRHAVSLPPPPLTLPLPLRRHQAAAERVSDFITQLFSQL
jgi:hypothetical protein